MRDVEEHLIAEAQSLLLLFFLIHGLYGLRVILIDVGVIREDSFFWRTMALAAALLLGIVWYVYVREGEL